MRRPTAIATFLAALLGALALAPAASGETALEQYQRTGRINPCTVSGGPGDIPNDIEQYAPDFLEAYRGAQRQGCDTGSTSTARPTETNDAGAPVAGGQALPPGATYVPKPPAPPKVAGHSRPVPHEPLAVAADRTTPAPLIALAVMLLLAIAGGALAATWRYMGWGLERLDPLHHAAGEARERGGTAVAAVADRLRSLVRRGA